MKKIFLGILAFALVYFSSCTKEIDQLEIETYKTFTEADFELPEQVYDDGLLKSASGTPQYAMIALETFSKKGEDRTRIVVHDKNFKNYSDLQVQVQITEYTAGSEIDGAPILKTITIVKDKDKSSSIVRSEAVVLTKSALNSIVSVSLVYIVGNEKIFSTKFNAFIDKDGMGAVQQPELRKDKNGLVSHYTFDDAHGLDESRTLRIQGVNDPAQEVAIVSVVIEGKKYLGNPYHRKGGFVIIIEGILMDVNPPFTVSVTLYNAKGTQIGQTENVEVSNSPKEIKAVFGLIENQNSGGTGFTLAAILEAKKLDKLEYIEIAFDKEASALLGSSNVLRIRKRPDLLLQEWDQLIDEQLVNLKDNPLAVAANDASNPLMFMESVIGKSFTFTATFYKSNGKAVSEPQTYTVIAKDNPKNDEPVIKSTRIFSIDGGKTWTYQAIIQDNGRWVEKVQVEFEKNPEAPNPVINPINLSRVKELEGNIEIYEGDVKFYGDPNSFGYSAMVYQFGSGTRSTAGQANNKAELL
jgi:hypothetical protein